MLRKLGQSFAGKAISPFDQIKETANFTFLQSAVTGGGGWYFRGEQDGACALPKKHYNGLCSWKSYHVAK